jgi:hypothetical protein
MKKMLLPMLALVVAVSLSAFTGKKERVSTSQEAWFVYDTGSKTSQNSYHYSASDPGCDESMQLCAVFAIVDESTIQNNNIATSKPLQAGEDIRSLEQLAEDSNEFTESTPDVELRNP